MNRISYFLVATLLGTMLAAQQSITTNLVGDEPGSAKGLYFDLEARAPQNVIGLDLHLRSGLQDVTICTTTSGLAYADLPSNGPEHWTVLGTATVSGRGLGQLTTVVMTIDVPLAANQRRGFFVHTTHPQGILAGDASSTLDGGDLLIRGGRSSANYLSNPGSNLRFEGRVRYQTARLQVESRLGQDNASASSARVLLLDVQAQEDVVISGIEIEIQNGSTDLRVWTMKTFSSHVGHETDPAAWRLAAELPGYTGAGLTRLPLDLDIQVPAGTTRGILIECASGSAAIVLGSALGQPSVADPFVTLPTPRSAGALFATPGPTARLHGALHYRRRGPGTVQSSASLTIDPGSTGTPVEGFFFDLSATDWYQLDHFEFPLRNGSSSNVNASFSLYRVKGGGTWVGHEGQNADWDLIGFRSLTLTPGQNTLSFSNLRLVLEPGAQDGFCIQGMPGSFLVANAGTTVGQVFSSAANLALHAGRPMTGIFSAVPAVVNGRVKIDAHPIGRAWRGFHEDFEHLAANFQPEGWLVHLEHANDRISAGWQFSSAPYVPTTLVAPLDSMIASIDSSGFGAIGNLVDASLISPSFDASNAPVLLTFHSLPDAYAVQTVDVWNGSSWTTVHLRNFSNSTGQEKLTLDITAAAAGCPDAAIRFRYDATAGGSVGPWLVDEVELLTGDCNFGTSQRPQLGLGEFDIGGALEANGFPVASGYRGPYFASARASQSTTFRWDGEPFQPVMLMVGLYNPGVISLAPQGQLDIGGYDPFTATFYNLEVLGDGTQPGFLNQMFRIGQAGRLEISVLLPSYTIGNTYMFQSLVFSSIQNIAITNTVELSVAP
ncbi:MAG: hypothetical protein H6807_03955 [Planctomycetes bacterium]|nr:hypothetical protein [Planctomycetota bacterium]